MKHLSRLFPIGAARERDIDLLLVEEFCSSARFRSWFLEQTVSARFVAGKFVGAWHSVVHPSLGESDLEVAFEGPDKGGFRLLIEDKIDAVAQPDQAERYRLRGEAYLRKSECTDFKTVIVAPERYLADKSETALFDAAITYESLRDWFLGQTQLGERASYKAALILAAMEEARRGYQPVMDERVTAFWKGYYDLAMQNAPELDMKPPGNKPAGAGFVEFKAAVLPARTRIVHKLPHGNVDLEFVGKGDSLGELERKHGRKLLPGMRIVRAGKSGAIRLKVPELDTSADFTGQSGSVEEGLAAARQLLAWIVEDCE